MAQSISSAQFAVAPNFLASGTTSAPTYPSVGGTGTTAKIFPLVNNSAQAVILNVPGDGKLEGKCFTIVASGKYSVGSTASPTLAVGIWSGSSLTVGSDTAFATSAASTTLTVSTSGNWSAYITCVGDSASGRLQPFGSSGSVVQISNAAAAAGENPAITVAALTGVKLSPSAGVDGYLTGSPSPAVQLVVGVTFGVSDANNAASLTEFYLEA